MKLKYIFPCFINPGNRQQCSDDQDVPDLLTTSTAHEKGQQLAEFFLWNPKSVNVQHIFVLSIITK